MLDEKLVANVRGCGMAQGAGKTEGRAGILRDLGFRTAARAEYVFLSSCYMPFRVPEAMRDLRHLLDHFGTDYTLLPKEYCCGAPMFIQAVGNKSTADLEKVDRLARWTLEENLRQMRAVGSSRMITFCPGCAEVHSRVARSAGYETLWYPAILERIFKGGRLDLEADFYAGCYSYYKEFTEETPDVEAAVRVLGRIDGLKIHRLNDRLCCRQEKQMQALTASSKSRVVITLCGGCTTRIQKAIEVKGGRALMLPQVVWASITGEVL